MQIFITVFIQVFIWYVFTNKLIRMYERKQNPNRQ